MGKPSFDENDDMIQHLVEKLGKNFLFLRNEIWNEFLTRILDFRDKVTCKLGMAFFLNNWWIKGK